MERGRHALSLRYGGIQSSLERRNKMNEQKEKAAFICTKDTLDGAYPSLVLGINAARMGMETKVDRKSVV